MRSEDAIKDGPTNSFTPEPYYLNITFRFDKEPSFLEQQTALTRMLSLAAEVKCSPSCF